MLKIKNLVVVLLAGVVGISSVGYVSALSVAPTFKDVNGRTTYYNSIIWAANKGVATGYGDGTWGPDNCVTRAEVLKMIAKTKPLPNAVKTGQTFNFPDVSSRAWYYDYVREAYLAGVVNGYDDGFFRPNNCVNRAEAIKIATNSLYSKPNLADFSGVVSYDDKLVVDVKSYDWFSSYMNFLFKKRVVGSDHTVSAGNVGGQPMIKFFPEGNMSRKEVAEMLYRVSVDQKWITAVRTW